SMDVSQLGEAVKVASREKNSELLEGVRQKLISERKEIQEGISNKHVPEDVKVKLRSELVDVDRLIRIANSELSKIEGIKTPEAAVKARTEMKRLSRDIDAIIQEFTPDKQEELNRLMAERGSIQTDLIEYYFDNNPGQNL